jgi:hypothetical protein
LARDGTGTLITRRSPTCRNAAPTRGCSLVVAALLSLPGENVFRHAGVHVRRPWQLSRDRADLSEVKNVGFFDRLNGTKRPDDAVPPAAEVRAALLGLDRPDVAYVVRDGPADDKRVGNPPRLEVSAEVGRGPGRTWRGVLIGKL